MTIVADSSVLIVLSNLDRLHWLHERFPAGLIVPPAVWREVVDQGGNRPGAVMIRAAKWIAVQPVSDGDYVRLLNATLGEGESEAIALAVERKASVLLLDDKAARRAASQLKLPVLGSIGIILWAYQTGRLVTLKEEIERMQNRGGFRLADNVIAALLQSVGIRD